MRRRSFLKASALGLTSLALPRPVFTAPKAAYLADQPVAQAATPRSEAWRTIEVVTKFDFEARAGAVLWIPLPKTKTTYQELLSTSWKASLSNVEIAKDLTYDDTFLCAHVQQTNPGLFELTYRVRVRDRDGAEPALFGEREKFLKPTEHVQIDGVVAETAHKIVKNAQDSDKKARLIYDWIVENTQRDASVRGCGLGDVKSTLTSGNLAGKCADLGSLFVGLARATGVPAREMFGCRALPSGLAKCLGKDGDISKGQHCRVEYLSERKKGWMPLDPADVRKAILEEKLSLTDPVIKSIRQKLFGFWEMNWIAYNSARDFSLPGSDASESDKINFLMYPRLIAGAEVRDGMEPDRFRYTMTARQIVNH